METHQVYNLDHKTLSSYIYTVEKILVRAILSKSSQMNKLLPSQALNRPLVRHKETSSIQSKAQEIRTTRRMGFRISNIGLLIAPQTISELTEILQVCPIPYTSVWLLGLINLRGNLVPVFDLYKLLQLEIGDVKKPRLLILGQGEVAGAILIQELPIHLTFTEEDKLSHIPPLPALIQPFTQSGYEKEGQLWFNFDHLGFFESLATKIAS